MRAFCALIVLSAAPAALGQPGGSAPGGDWLRWRGPNQDGTSDETGLVDTVELDGEHHLWTLPLAGRGTPVVDGDRLYALAYAGEGADLQELLLRVDARTGEIVWERRFNDFLSDVIYNRYAIGSPAVDPETGNVVAVTAPGTLAAFDPDGKLLWLHDLMAEFGRMTFPNGRNGAPVVDGERVILHSITSGWGAHAPARDRFLAFDKRTGDCLWVSTPGTGPKDNSFSQPLLTWQGARRVLIAGTGCGHVVCVDARTGEPVWRYRLSIGGVNSSVVPYKDGVIAIHGRENLDDSTIGRMLYIPIGMEPQPDTEGPIELKPSEERWRNDLAAFTSSPVVVGDRVYQTVATGELCCVDADTGKVLWTEKLAPDQIHASPAAGDGKLYVPMTNGSFHVVRPTDEGAEILSRVELEGSCLGAPAIAGGRVFVHTTGGLYCFGDASSADARDAGAARADGREAAAELGEPGSPAQLQVVPADLLLRAGEEASFRARLLDSVGRLLGTPEVDTWEAVAGLELNSLDQEGAGSRVRAASEPGAGLLTARASGLQGAARVRVVPEPPFREDFEGFELSAEGPEGAAVAHPPAWWLGGRPKWDVRERDGSKVLAKTLEISLFQRTLTLFGHPETSGYTMQVDVMSDGNRRTMSTAGVVHQRYLVLLKGNHQEIEVSSNMERIKESVPFRWKPGVWYTLKSRVDVAPDGSGTIRAKAWKRDEPEPDGWSIEVAHAVAHARGAPGLFGFAPQSRFRVYVDNIVVTPNDE